MSMGRFLWNLKVVFLFVFSMILYFYLNAFVVFFFVNQSNMYTGGGFVDAKTK